MVGWVYGVLRAVAAVRASTGAGPDALFFWTAVPFLSVVSAFVASGHSRLAPLWVAAGLCCSFVVLAAWSLGLFFAWSAVLLLAAGVAHAVTIRAGWRTVAAIVGWFAVGATGLCAALLAYGQARVILSGGRIITASPAIMVVGARSFVGLLAVLSVSRAAQVRLRRFRD
jgi:hypothetical protein